MLQGRDYSTVHFYLGADEETATVSWQTQVEFVPRVGDIVMIYSSRDKDGNYMNADARASDEMVMLKIMKGKVSRVEHNIEERGRSSTEHAVIQFVDVFLEQVTPTKDEMAEVRNLFLQEGPDRWLQVGSAIEDISRGNHVQIEFEKGKVRNAR